MNEKDVLKEIKKGGNFTSILYTVGKHHRRLYETRGYPTSKKEIDLLEQEYRALFDIILKLWQNDRIKIIMGEPYTETEDTFEIVL